MRPRALLAVALLLAILAAPAARAGQVLDAAREYRQSLDRLLPYQEDAERRAAATLEQRRAQLAAGLIARRDVEEAERALETAAARAGRTRVEIFQADALVREAEVDAQLAALPRRGGRVAGPTFTLHRGPRAWALGEVGAIERFFASRFGRPLPVSALGQTSLHTRLGFDHRNALDVAVHPDTDEGRALVAWLERQGVSFIAFRSAVPGSATGAHIHVGEPSPRGSTILR